MGLPAALGQVLLLCGLATIKTGPRSSLELKYAPLLVAGGLRGAVTIALALSLPAELDD